jgi:colanic acid/amylovoran biosynthesis protein
MKTVEIYGTGVHNLGAVLMAEAATERLLQADPNAQLVVGAGYGDAAARGRLGFGLVDDVPGRLAGPYLRWAPASLRRILGIVSVGAVDAVLDASGFAYADAFGARPAEYLLTRMQRNSRRGQKLILLPQAYGPFEDPEVARACRLLFERADLMFARDPESQQAANSLIGEDKAILSPDFTIGLAADASTDFQLPERYIAFVPNFRMLKRENDPDGAAYISLVTGLLQRATDSEMEVIIVLHSSDEDVALANRVSAEVPGARIVTHANPRSLKAVLGGAQAVIGSRFHALVSAMSQGVPCLGLGWAHKYAWLFHDFGADDFLIDVQELEVAQARLDLLLDPETARENRDLLTQKAQELKSQNDIMWARVTAAVGIGGADALAGR